MKPWAISYDGHLWRSDEMTAGEALDVAMVAGGGWLALDPYGHPGSLVAIVAVLMASRTGLLLEDALAQVRAMKAADLMACLVDDPGGPVSEAPSTPAPRRPATQKVRRPPTPRPRGG